MRGRQVFGETEHFRQMKHYIQEYRAESPDQGSAVTRWAGWGGGREVQEGGDICVFSPSICYESADKDHKEGWVSKNWCLWTMVLEKTFESPLDYKEIKPVNPKGNHPWIFTGGTDAEAEVPILWPSDTKNRLIGKDPGAGKDWRLEEKGTTENEMVGWHHRLNGHELE